MSKIVSNSPMAFVRWLTGEKWQQMGMNLQKCVLYWAPKVFFSFWVPKMCSFLGAKSVFSFGCQKCVPFWAPKVCLILGAKSVSFSWVPKMCFPFGCQITYVSLHGCQKCVFLIGAKNVLLSGRQKCAYNSDAKNVFNHRR